MAQSTSDNFQLDWERETSGTETSGSETFNLVGGITDISAEGTSVSYNMRNVYSERPVCGNGVLEVGEQCEGTAYGNCADYGYTHGELQCAECVISTGMCYTAVEVGDGTGANPPTPTTKEPEPVEDTGMRPQEEEPEPVEDTEMRPQEEEPEPVVDTGMRPQEDEPDTETRPVAPKGIYHDFHFRQYEIEDEIIILDETPFIATQLSPNAFYEVITKQNEEVIYRQGAQADPKGILAIELFPHLNYGNYILDILNNQHTTEKRFKLKIEGTPYRQHEIIQIGKTTIHETINLGVLKANTRNIISGKGTPYAEYFTYYRHFEKNSTKKSIVTFVTTSADKEGNFTVPVPENFKSGFYRTDIIQVYEDGAVSRNKRYIFEIKNSIEEKTWPSVWIIILIAIAALIGNIGRRRNQRKKTSKIAKAAKIAIWIILLTAITGLSAITSVSAATTTPAPFIYEGKLLNKSNVPLTNEHIFRFSLWSLNDWVTADTDIAGAINTGSAGYGGWQEEHSVTPNSNGTFFVELGSTTPLPDISFSSHKFLQVEIKTSGSADTSYELMDPSGDNGVDTEDRQTIGSSPYAKNADFIDNAEVGTSEGDVALLGTGDVWNINFIPGGTNIDSFVLDYDDSAGAGDTIDLQFGSTIAATLSFDINNNWFSFNKDVDFAQNQLKNAAFDNRTTAPASPVSGQIYHNTSNGNTYVWNGTDWDDITPVGGAGGADDLDSVYDADVDRKMDVDSNLGLEFESTTAGDIIFDLQSTGNLIVQDAGSPFAIFTDGGQFGIGNLSPESILHADSNAANTTPIITMENTAGNIQFFRTDSTPENNITGSIGDIAIDGTSGEAYIKNTGDGSNTGWEIFAGVKPKQMIFQTEYKHGTAEGDGSNNKGILSSDSIDSGGTDKYNFYEWVTSQGSIQDIDIVLSVKLPDDFVSFSSSPLSILYNTSDADTGNNKIDITLYDTTGTAVTLTGGNNLANGSWSTANITFGGAPTFTAGDTVTLRLKLSATSSSWARVGDVILRYNGQ